MRFLQLTCTQRNPTFALCALPGVCEGYVSRMLSKSDRRLDPVVGCLTHLIHPPNLYDDSMEV